MPWDLVAVYKHVMYIPNILRKCAMTAGKKKPNKDSQEGKNSPEQLYSGYVDLFSLSCVCSGLGGTNYDIIATRDIHTYTLVQQVHCSAQTSDCVNTNL